ncbi:DNA-processing protein DprA [Desulfoferrobacter suflitae]|uniref:DNA-processing protein DprA n=1 Tax=Desulfoferrobacter suflitae TaxID=2865782 RepID=UPI0021648F69|nr:DNA-processing protein DprA [Desulfoferrobacter suflitae]MCK8602005.1 DNA-processing protein DprA [Desulfoferrobacter suflitae]
MEAMTGIGEEERIAWLTLTLIPGLGNRSILRLIEHFGSPLGVLRAAPKAVAGVPGLRDKAKQALLKKATMRSPEFEFKRLQDQQVQLLCLNDADYPANLRAIPDPPAVLFVKGTIEARDLVSVSVVGSRAASPLGIAFTERLCMDLSQYGVTIVSGLAVGIDSAAHRGALRGKGRTLAVLGCGLDIEYPRINRALRGQIIKAGALLSEFPLETLPSAGNFPMRNRIISGLSLGVVVVEAAHRSGSLITARFALEQGREVFAVPGMARHYRSVGPHRLLKQGAKLVESAEDVLEELRPLIRVSGNFTTTSRTTAAPPDLSGDEARLLNVLDQHPRHADDLCRALQLPAAEVMVILLNLELKGCVQQLPGKFFVRCDDNIHK